MDFRNKRRELHGVVGGLGVVAGIAGFVGGAWPAGTTITLMFGIWIVGATLVNLFTGSVLHHILQLQQEGRLQPEVLDPVVGHRVLLPVGDEHPGRIFLHDRLHLLVKRARSS
jgi:hypothetical protein